ncbi:hypothetical protein [Dactylosporangium sp. CA-233914]|uniref:hypothetical protein n=1 Tax=Dactylosporangium sp. CA-233914 TaxID=3239934 RepID=UPI003D8D143D
MAAADDLHRVAYRVRTEPSLYCALGSLEPHPAAATLILPDGSPAPAELRIWAACDNRYPTDLSVRRGEQPVADADGVVLVEPMADVLRRVCVDDVLEELGEDTDDELPEYLDELHAGFVAELPGHGVVLGPAEHPARLLWLPRGGAATVIWYEDEQFARRETFAAWVVRLIED